MKKGLISILSSVISILIGLLFFLKDFSDKKEEAGS